MSDIRVLCGWNELIWFYLRAFPLSEMDTTSEMQHLSLLNNSEINNIVTNTTHFVSAPEWAKYVELTYLGIVAVLGVPGNSLIIVVQAKTAVKTSTDYFILLMGVIELLCSGINAPVRMLITLETIWSTIASSSLCAVRGFVLYVVTMCSSLLLGAISLDRYIQTCHPLNSKYGPTMAKMICIIIGVIGVICGFPNLLLLHLGDTTRCRVYSNMYSFKSKWDIALAVLTMAILITICFAYSSISLHIRKRHRERINKRHFVDKLEASRSAMVSCWSCCKTNRTKVSPSTAETEEAVVSSVISQTHSGQLGTDVRPTDYSSNGDTCDTRQLSNIGTSIDGNTATMRRLVQEDRINRTTRIMFLITLVYMVLWLTTWIRIMSYTSLMGSAFITFSRSFYMISCLTNPLIFICMSSRFRQKANQLFTR